MDCRILLVDDDPHLLAALRRRLGRMYSVTAVMNAEDGSSTDADQGPYALALSDRQMRRLDCAGCPRECAPDTIRIMLTSNADPTIEERVIEEAEVFFPPYQALPVRGDRFVNRDGPRPRGGRYRAGGLTCPHGKISAAFGAPAMGPPRRNTPSLWRWSAPVSLPRFGRLAAACPRR